jgi:hypothetical protein
MKIRHALKEFGRYDFNLIEVQIQVFQVGHIVKDIALDQVYFILVQVQILEMY